MVGVVCLYAPFPTDMTIRDLAQVDLAGMHHNMCSDKEVSVHFLSFHVESSQQEQRPPSIVTTARMALLANEC